MSSHLGLPLPAYKRRPIWNRILSASSFTSGGGWVKTPSPSSHRVAAAWDPFLNDRTGDMWSIRSGSMVPGVSGTFETGFYVPVATRVEGEVRKTAGKQATIFVTMRNNW